MDNPETQATSDKKHRTKTNKTTTTQKKWTKPKKRGRKD